MSTAQARRDARDRATALALLDRVFGVEDVYISVRNVGEAGRWMKSGWQHLDSSTLDNCRLWQTPAEAFIHQLTEVEELAVLVTDDEGGNTTAVFDVRYLSTALASDDAGWGVLAGGGAYLHTGTRHRPFLPQHDTVAAALRRFPGCAGKRQERNGKMAGPLSGVKLIELGRPAPFP